MPNRWRQRFRPSLNRYSPIPFFHEDTMSNQKEIDFSWQAIVGDREMNGTARTAIERDSRREGAVDLMKRDPLAGSPIQK